MSKVALLLPLGLCCGFVLLSPAPRSPRSTLRSQQNEQERTRDYYQGMLTSSATSDDATKDMLTPSLKLAGGASVVLLALLAAFFAANIPPAAASEGLEPRSPTAADTVVFLIGTVPFAWAGVEFWRRIAVGEPFGTGTDSVVFESADEDQVRRFGGRRVLGKDAILAARVLFGVAAGSLALTVVAYLQL